ncbi:MAG: GatB/YqeY domain-containing protein, partial [Bacteroidetes bacterium]|nr:GatB/YqeY domain-containing protein [Bacteroidota bacterium]
QKLAKQRRDSLEQFRNAGRDDLASKEQEELEVLESYLPEQMDEATLRSKISALIEETGAQGAKDLGKVMPLAMKEFGSQAEGKLISALVKELLG